MFEPISTVFSTTPEKWDKTDARHFVQEYLRHELKVTEAIYCDSVQGDTAYVRATTPALRQAVLLLEYDVVLELAKHSDFKLKRVALSREK